MPYETRTEELNAYRSLGTPGELAAMAKAKQDGWMVELPCKLGDTVYRKGRFNDTIIEAFVQSITINGFGFTMKATNGNNTMFCFDKEDIGERIFLSREAAEAALAVEEENNEQN